MLGEYGCTWKTWIRISIELPSSTFAVGLVTHYLPKNGSIAWISQPTFAAKPSTEEVASIADWRWTIFFPVAAAIRGKIFEPIGTVEIPTTLRQPPLMRTRSVMRDGWSKVQLRDDLSGADPVGRTEDKTLPIYAAFTDLDLEDMIDDGWVPAHRW